MDTTTDNCNAHAAVSGSTLSAAAAAVVVVGGGRESCPEPG
jgi:hypothetical protein